MKNLFFLLYAFVLLNSAQAASESKDHDSETTPFISHETISVELSVTLPSDAFVTDDDIVAFAAGKMVGMCPMTRGDFHNTFKGLTHAQMHTLYGHMTQLSAGLNPEGSGYRELSKMEPDERCAIADYLKDKMAEMFRTSEYDRSKHIMGDFLLMFKGISRDQWDALYAIKNSLVKGLWWKNDWEVIFHELAYVNASERLSVAMLATRLIRPSFNYCQRSGIIQIINKIPGIDRVERIDRVIENMPTTFIRWTPFVITEALLKTELNHPIPRELTHWF